MPSASPASSAAQATRRRCAASSASGRVASTTRTSPGSRLRVEVSRPHAFEERPAPRLEYGPVAPAGQSAQSDGDRHVEGQIVRSAVEVRMHKPCKPRMSVPVYTPAAALIGLGRIGEAVAEYASPVDASAGG